MQRHCFTISMASVKCQTTVRLCCFRTISHQHVLKNEKHSTEQMLPCGRELWKCPHANAKPSLNIWEVKIRLKVLFHLTVGECVELWTQPELHLQTHTERNYSSYNSNIPGKQEDLCNQRHTAMKQMYITPVFHVSSIFHSPLNKEH